VIGEVGGVRFFGVMHPSDGALIVPYLFYDFEFFN
jgi:hypothetical protein